MRRTAWLLSAFALLFAVAAAGAVSLSGARKAEEKPEALGVGPAYQALGGLAVLHEGRQKPLDTMAREEVRLIFSRETVKIIDTDLGNKVVATWGPVAALFDWGVRPEVWDDQPLILVEYMPLKAMILADSIQARLKAAAEKSATSAIDREGLRKLALSKDLTAAQVSAFLAGCALPGTAEKPLDDRRSLAGLAAELSEAHKWLTPRQLEECRIEVETGRVLKFMDWMGEISEKRSKGQMDTTGAFNLTEVEKRAWEAAGRLSHYQAARDRDSRTNQKILVMPRPSNPAYLAFLAKTVKDASDGRTMRDLTPLQLDGALTLQTYWKELPGLERATPGTDPEFDREFADWLAKSSAWVPLKTLLDTKTEDLAAAGFPAKEVAAFKTAFTDLERAEYARPGRVDQAAASALVASARSLGQAVSPESYPPVSAIARETHFNAMSPFWLAPIGYGLAVALLAVSVGFIRFEPKTLLGRFGRATYGLGLAGLVAGIALEAYGFNLRIRISGWAPVTNMYETVIWVGLVAAVLGLVFEAVYRRRFAALSGAMVGLVGTLLAANVPLLDPDIKELQPVLQSNYWLGIHVLTEVSSYGAFMQAAFLGLIASTYYLTATYRRSPSYTELALPVVPGLPLLAVGSVGVCAAYGLLGPKWVVGDGLFYATGAMAGLGGCMTLAALAGLAGEAVSRLNFREELARDGGAETDRQSESLAEAPAYLGAGASTGGVATLTRPTVAEIRARAAAAGPPPVDARGRSMRATAERIKPLSNLIYRTMQVGVLLIAAGTVLGGMWADVSWGRFWGWDPKEVWALITLLVYLIPLHGRFAGWFNTFAFVTASVVCSLSVIMAWYGVNFVLGVGLHSYGFTEGGGQGVVLAVILAVLALPAGAWWRRSLGSRAVLDA